MPRASSSSPDELDGAHPRAYVHARTQLTSEEAGDSAADSPGAVVQPPRRRTHSRSSAASAASRHASTSALPGTSAAPPQLLREREREQAQVRSPKSSPSTPGRRQRAASADERAAEAERQAHLAEWRADNPEDVLRHAAAWERDNYWRAYAEAEAEADEIKAAFLADARERRLGGGPRRAEPPARPSPPARESESAQVLDDDDEEAPRDDVPSDEALLVFQCVQCGAVLGDSLAWVVAQRELALLVLSAVTPAVQTDPSLHTSSASGPDLGSTFSTLACAPPCSAPLGRTYRTTPAALDELRSAYALDIAAVRVYQLGSAMTASGVPARHAHAARHAEAAPAARSGALDDHRVRVLLMGLGERLLRLEQTVQGLLAPPPPPQREQSASWEREGSHGSKRPLGPGAAPPERGAQRRRGR